MSNIAAAKRRKISFEHFFKYSVYLLLCINIFLFLHEEWLASDHLFTDGVSLAQVIQAFAQTIDTAAWVVLLLLFELETFVLDDDKIKGPLKWTIHGVRAACYVIIVYAVYGYSVKCFDLYQFSALPVEDLCSLPGYSFMTTLDEFTKVSRNNCMKLSQSTELFGINTANVVTDASTHSAVIRLAWSDIINSVTWILVVLMLEVEVRLQLKGQLHGSMLTFSKFFKALLYAILLSAAIYWGVAGDFVDFWDAFLWIVAFIFIEKNLFDWNAETKALDKAAGFALQK